MSSSKNIEFNKTGFLSKSNSAFIEQMYLQYINKDSNLPQSWKNYFDEIGDEVYIVINEINGPSWSPKKNKISVKDIRKKITENGETNQLEIIRSNANSIKAVAMIRSYRQRGHLIAKLDPLSMMKSDYLDELHPESYGFKKEDYDKKIFLDGVTNKQYSNIKEILKFLKEKYCGSSGYEYMHISNPTERKWFRDRVEKADDLFAEGIKAWSCSGTPADCIKLALYELLSDKPDLILSGINHGPNLGTDVFCSGTVAAAMEGTLEGIPSMAVSIASYQWREFKAFNP